MDEAKLLLNTLVRQFLRAYDAEPGLDVKLMHDVRSIFVEDMKDEVKSKLNNANYLINFFIHCGSMV
jgi:hypothetical protein